MTTGESSGMERNVNPCWFIVNTSGQLGATLDDIFHPLSRFTAVVKEYGPNEEDPKKIRLLIAGRRPRALGLGVKKFCGYVEQPKTIGLDSGDLRMRADALSQYLVSN